MLNGILTVSQGVSRVNGVPLAICSAADPFGGATNFIASRGFGNGSHVIVSGSPGTIGSTPVFCMTDVQAAAAAAEFDEPSQPATIEEIVIVTASTVEPAARPVGRTKPRTRPAKKAAAAKRGAKKTRAKKKAVKKTGAKKRKGQKQQPRRRSTTRR